MLAALDLFSKRSRAPYGNLLRVNFSFSAKFANPSPQTFFRRLLGIFTIPTTLICSDILKSQSPKSQALELSMTGLKLKTT